MEGVGFGNIRLGKALAADAASMAASCRPPSPPPAPSVRKEDTVKLISAEGFEFVIDRQAALVSNTLKSMLTSSGSFTETQLGEVRFPEISTPILEKVCQYFYWSLQFASGKETEFQIEPEMTLELLMAANYLHT